MKYFNSETLNNRRAEIVTEMGDRCVLHPNFKTNNIRGRNMEAVKAAAEADRQRNPAHIAWAKVQHIYGVV